MMYNKIVHDFFFFPLHIGTLDCLLPRTVYFRSEQLSQNIITDLYMQCDEDHTIRSMCYKTNGNPFMIASLEWLCRQAIGKLCDGLYLNSEELIKILEIPANQTFLILYIKDVYAEILILMNNALRVSL
jgi:nitrogen fixation protein NifU and related proteins